MFSQCPDGKECWSSGGCYDNSCCPSCQPFQPYPARVPNIWVDPAYLLWWVKGFSTPPLVTTSPAGTPRAVAGVLGQPTTSILSGGSAMAGDVRSGGRINVGFWFDPRNTAGIEATYMRLATDVDNFSASSAGGAADPILARPFFNVEAGFEGQDAELVAYPGLLSGRIGVRAETSLEGIEVLWRRAMAGGCNYRLDFLAGWRHNYLRDELVINDFKTSLDAASGLAVGTTLQESDVFRTENWFNGAEIGVSGKGRRNRWTIDLSMKLALGNTHSEAVVDGSTTTTVPLPGGGTDVSVTHAGLLAQSTNIGVYRRDQFADHPRAGATLGFNLTERLQASNTCCCSAPNQYRIAPVALSTGCDVEGAAGDGADADVLFLSGCRVAAGDLDVGVTAAPDGVGLPETSTAGPVAAEGAAANDSLAMDGSDACPAGTDAADAAAAAG